MRSRKSPPKVRGQALYAVVFVLTMSGAPENMKVSTLLAVVIPALAVAAVPVADLDPAAVQVEARDLTQAQCKAACDSGADAVERFCRRIPERRVKAACWAAATAVQSPIGQRACVAFCDAWF